MAKAEVPFSIVSCVLDNLSQNGKAVVELFMLAGIEPADTCRLTLADVDRRGNGWECAVGDDRKKRPVGPRAGNTLELLRRNTKFAGAKNPPLLHRQDGTAYTVEEFEQEFRDGCLKCGEVTPFEWSHLRYMASVRMLGTNRQIASFEREAGF